MNKGHIFFISGISGAGKSSVVKMIKNLHFPNVECVLSCKTRPLRQGEVSGIDYHYLTRAQFQEGIEKGKFLEYNFVHNQDYYGTLYSDVVENGIEKGKFIIKEIDVGVIEEIRQKYPELQADTTFIFLDIPTESIKERMLLRGDDISGDDYKNRVASSIKEHAMMHLCDCIIDSNRHIEGLYKDVLDIIQTIIVKKTI